MCIVGCGVCLYQPLHTEDMAFFTPELLGKWKTENPNATWEFKQGEGKSYSLRSNLSKATKTVYLARLGDTLFMSTTGFPNAEESDQPTCQYILSGKVVLHDDRLTFYPVAVQSLAAMLKEAKNSPPYEHSESDTVNFIVFTGESQPTQQFLSKHAKNKELFDASLKRTFTRVSD